MRKLTKREMRCIGTHAAVGFAIGTAATMILNGGNVSGAIRSGTVFSLLGICPELSRIATEIVNENVI